MMRDASWFEEGEIVVPFLSRRYLRKLMCYYILN